MSPETIDTPLQRWAEAKAAMRLASDAELEKRGLTYESLGDLEQEAIAQMGDSGYVDTEYGRVQVKPDGPVLWTARRSAEVTTKKLNRLILLKPKV